MYFYLTVELFHSLHTVLEAVSFQHNHYLTILTTIKPWIRTFKSFGDGKSLERSQFSR